MFRASRGIATDTSQTQPGEARSQVGAQEAEGKENQEADLHTSESEVEDFKRICSKRWTKNFDLKKSKEEMRSN